MEGISQQHQEGSTKKEECKTLQNRMDFQNVLNISFSPISNVSKSENESTKFPADDLINHLTNIVTNKHSTETCEGRLNLQYTGQCQELEKTIPCSLCKHKIQNKYLLYALEKYWHEKCLKCDFCRKPLYKSSNRFYYRQGAKFCREDFLR